MNETCQQQTGQARLVRQNSSFTNQSEEDDNIEFNLEEKQREISNIYQELAEKEQALLMAAQFGQNLIEEKEELEKQIENMKREHQNQLENFEQESYQFKRLIESMRNEYESKIYELNEDISILTKQLKQKDLSLSMNTHVNKQNEQLELIQELNEKNQSLVNELKNSQLQLGVSNDNNQILENKLGEKEKIISENSKLLINFQKEISKLVNKHQEIEFILMQSYNEREKQSKIIEDLTNKYIIMENEKNELENLMYQHENELFNLRKLNQSLLYKFEKLENLNENNLHSGAANLNRKHRAFPYSNTISSNLSNINISNSLSKSPTIASLSTKQTHSKSKNVNNNKIININCLNNSFEMMTNDETRNTNSNQDDNNNITTNNEDNNKSSDDSNDNHLNMSLISCSNYFNTSSTNENSPLSSNDQDQKSLRNVHYLNRHSNNFNSNSNLDDCSEFDEDIEINLNNDIDVYKMNEIEQDEDEDAVIFSKSDYFDEELNSIEGVNWLQETAEHQIQDEDKECLSVHEKKVNYEDYLSDEKPNNKCIEKNSELNTSQDNV